MAQIGLAVAKQAWPKQVVAKTGHSLREHGGSEEWREVDAWRESCGAVPSRARRKTVPGPIICQSSISIDFRIMPMLIDGRLPGGPAVSASSHLIPSSCVRVWVRACVRAAAAAATAQRRADLNPSPPMRIRRDAARHHGLRRACLASDPEEPLLSSTCRRHALRRSLWTVLVAMCGSCVWLVAQRSARGPGNHIADLAREGRPSSLLIPNTRELPRGVPETWMPSDCPRLWTQLVRWHNGTLHPPTPTPHGTGRPPPATNTFQDSKERPRRPRTRMTAPLAAVWR